MHVKFALLEKEENLEKTFVNRTIVNAMLLSVIISNGSVSKGRVKLKLRCTFIYLIAF